MLDHRVLIFEQFLVKQLIVDSKSYSIIENSSVFLLQYSYDEQQQYISLHRMYLFGQIYSCNQKEILHIDDHDRFSKDLHFDHNPSTIITNEMK
jgi:hypothetical protein